MKHMPELVFLVLVIWNLGFLPQYDQIVNSRFFLKFL